MTKRITSLVLAFFMLLGVFGAVTASADEVKILGDLSIKTGETKPLKFTDPNGNVVQVIWESSNPDVATVDDKGSVTGKKAGTCVISTYWNGKLYGVNIKVTAKKTVYAKIRDYLKKNGTKEDQAYNIAWLDDGYRLWANFNAEKKSVLVFIGDPVQYPVNEFDVNDGVYLELFSTGKKRVTYYNLNTKSIYDNYYKKGATVNTATMKLKNSGGPAQSNANSKAKKYAKAGMSLWNKFLKARMNLTVKKMGFIYKSTSKKISLNKTKLTLYTGRKYTLKLKNAKASKVKWTSSKKSVATVSKKGVVKAKKKGTATITAKYKGKKYTCKLTVK